jgi:PmbA protein
VLKKDLLELANSAVRTALASGANACSVSASADRSVEIDYRERRPETIKEASTRGLLIRLYVEGRYSAQSTSDLRPDALKRFIGDAVQMTRLLAADPDRTLPDPKYYEGRQAVDLDLVDPRQRELTATDRHAIARAAEAACLADGGPGVVSATSGWNDGSSESLLVTSNGFEGYNESTYFSLNVQVTLQDEGDRRPNGFEYAVATRRADLPAPEAIGAGAVRRTRALMGGKKIKTETLPIIIENRGAGRVIAPLLQAMAGRAVQQKQSFLADRKGQKIASDLLTLIDDPFVPRGLGSCLYDGEGITAKKRTMIEAGVLKEFYVDWYYGRKLGWEPTTAGASNLIIPPGQRSVNEIMKGLGRGILVTGFIGGNANSTTGDFSAGIFGLLFENGETTQAVAEMNIAGNSLELWSKLVEVANDPWPYSSLRVPSLAFQDVVVSGI